MPPEGAVRILHEPDFVVACGPQVIALEKLLASVGILEEHRWRVAATHFPPRACSLPAAAAAASPICSCRERAALVRLLVPSDGLCEKFFVVNAAAHPRQRHALEATRRARPKLFSVEEEALRDVAQVWPSAEQPGQQQGGRRAGGVERLEVARLQACELSSSRALARSSKALARKPRLIRGAMPGPLDACSFSTCVSFERLCWLALE